MRFVLRRKKNNFRVPAVVMAATLAVGALSGCGGEYETAFHGGAASVSGTAVNVTEQAVSGQALNSQKEETPHRYCTDTNLYCDYVDCIVQTRLDGTKAKEIKLKNFAELLCIREGYLYYVTEIDGQDTAELESYEVCRVPVEKDADGWDVIETEREEKVISAEDEKIDDVLGMNSQCIFYSVDDEVTDYSILIRYDIQSQKKVRLDVISVDKGARGYIVTDSYLLACTYGGFFMMGMEGTEWTKVSDSDAPCVCETEAWDEKAFFYTTPNDGDYRQQSTAVRKCDLTELSDRVFISEKDLKEKVMEAEGVNEDEVDVCNVSELFIEENRLYIQIQLNWRREGTYHMGYLMLSQGEEETELRYEKELTECMKTYGATRKGQWGYNTTAGNKIKRIVWEDDVLINDNCCLGIVNGKAFLWFHNAKKKYGCVGCFELATASFRWLTESDTEYYELLQDDLQGYGTFGEWGSAEFLDAFPDYSMEEKNRFWGPRNEEAGVFEGEFYEDSED